MDAGDFVHPSRWRRGFVTEWVDASLRLTFEDPGLKEVLPFAKPDNTASRRVLSKSGFSLVRTVPKLERHRCAITLQVWERRRLASAPVGCNGNRRNE